MRKVRIDRPISLVESLLEAEQQNAEALKQEINDAIANAGINIDYGVEGILEGFMEKLQEAAEESDAFYDPSMAWHSDRYDDGDDGDYPANISGEYELDQDEYYAILNCDAQARMTSRGSAATYDYPGDPAEFGVEINKAILEIYPPHSWDEDNLIGKWDVTSLLK